MAAPGPYHDAGFTVQERSILLLVAAGCRNPQIARRLYISRNTVKVHLANCYARTGTRTAAQALAVAVARGVITAAELAAVQEGAG